MDVQYVGKTLCVVRYIDFVILMLESIDNNIVCYVIVLLKFVAYSV